MFYVEHFNLKKIIMKKALIFISFLLLIVGVNFNVSEQFLLSFATLFIVAIIQIKIKQLEK